tara:strand:- start:756 stop:1118 length:363 start_codon:yes stop_codon:yes gene_type:complete
METPNKMIGGIAGMAQPNQMQLNQYPNQNALGALGPQIPGIVGQNIPGTTNNVMSNQAGVSAPIGAPIMQKKTEPSSEEKPKEEKPKEDKIKTTLKTVAAETAKMMTLGKMPKTFKNLNN